ncbi:hypothetical protein C1H46_001823 [Malus baccata]|uniref:Uncharacterized protein n=2 Tax=Malus TaxID=3749 RepID=A0A540NNM3_MALBA|nr:hypothetical protein C1H46_001823 [Malus baccata]
MDFRKPNAIQQRPVLLKDFLMDDLSSCSSNGFKSFPRHQCCTTTVRFLLDIEFKSSSSSSQLSTHKYPSKITSQKPVLHRSRFRAAAACDAFINAVKSLPSSPSVRRGVVFLLPKSLSRRLRRKKFWKKQSKEEKKEENDIGRWRLFREFLHDEPPPSDQNTTTTAKTVVTVSRHSTSTRSRGSDGNSSSSNSWAESEFTLSSQSSGGNDGVDVKTTSLVKDKVSEKVGGEVGEDSVSMAWPTTTTSCSPQNDKEGWLNNKEEKEQFSPVSVLDCPFEDEDDDHARSPLSRSLACMQGTQQKLMRNIRRIENLAQQEPVDLEQRMKAIMDSEAEAEARASLMHTANCHAEQVNKTEEKTSNKLVSLKAEKVVMDLCRETIVEKKSDESAVMREAVEDWINGESQELLLGWEVEEGRKVYVKDMENEWGSCKELDCERQEVGLELEAEMKNEDDERFLFGISLSDRPRWQQFIICSSGFFFGYLVNGICEEYVYNRLEFSYGWYFTFVQGFVYIALMYLQGFTPKKMVNPWKTYVKLSAVLMGSQGLTKGSLAWLNYPAQIMFKSTKVLPVMVMGAFVPGLRRKYPIQEYISATLLVMGLILFTLADAKTSPNFSMAGVIMISGALIMDAFLGNLQEAIFTLNPGTTQTEMLFCSTVVGLPFLLPPMILTGELVKAWNSCSEHPYVYGVLVFEALATYVGQVSVLSLIALFGAATTAMITTARKAVTLLLSYMIFTKPLTGQHGTGLLLIAMGITMKTLPENKVPGRGVISHTVAKYAKSFKLGKRKTENETEEFQ